MYSINHHTHVFAAWSAATAARAGTCKFKVKTGRKILEEIGFNETFINPNKLPTQEKFDVVHKKWCDNAIKSAKRYKIKNFKHGVAAKLINCYLKVKFVCGGHANHPKVKYIHPPIDRLLLQELKEKNIGDFGEEWSSGGKLSWSHYDYISYNEIIKMIQKTMPNQPLWKIEQYWPGHQK